MSQDDERVTELLHMLQEKARQQISAGVSTLFLFCCQSSPYTRLTSQIRGFWYRPPKLVRIWTCYLTASTEKRSLTSPCWSCPALTHAARRGLAPLSGWPSWSHH